MFVIDGVELRLLDQPQQMRKFERDRAAGLQRHFQATGEIVDRRHVGIDIVADDQIGLSAVGGQAPSQVLTEEFAQHRNAEPLGRGRRACRRFDAEAGNAGGDKILQQIAVIAGDFDDQTVAAELQFPDDGFAIARRVREPAGRRAGEISILRAEQLVGRRVILGLHQPALIADHDLQRIIFFRPRKIVRAQIGVRGRRKAEIEEGVRERARAMAALHNATPANWSFSMGCCASRTDNSVIGSGQAIARRCVVRIEPGFGRRAIGGRVAVQELDVIGQRLENRAQSLPE